MLHIVRIVNKMEEVKEKINQLEGQIDMIEDGKKEATAREYLDLKNQLDKTKSILSSIELDFNRSIMSHIFDALTIMTPRQKIDFKKLLE